MVARAADAPLDYVWTVACPGKGNLTNTQTGNDTWTLSVGASGSGADIELTGEVSARVAPLMSLCVTQLL